MPSYFFLTVSLGLRPISPGFKEFSVEIEPGPLSWAKGTLPTPHGSIGVEWHKEGDKLLLDLDVPQGTTARLRVSPGQYTQVLPGLNQGLAVVPS